MNPLAHPDFSLVSQLQTDCLLLARHYNRYLGKTHGKRKNIRNLHAEGLRLLETIEGRLAHSAVQNLLTAPLDKVMEHIPTDLRQGNEVAVAHFRAWEKELPGFRADVKTAALNYLREFLVKNSPQPSKVRVTDLVPVLRRAHEEFQRRYENRKSTPADKRQMALAGFIHEAKYAPYGLAIMSHNGFFWTHFNNSLALKSVLIGLTAFQGRLAA
jgi:hypothetical protein